MFDTASKATENPPAQVAAGKADRTRTRLIHTALVLFRQRGYRKTTMRAIAKAAGMSLGSTYYYFASKEELAGACYERAHQEYGPACDTILSSGRDFRELLLGVIRAKIATLLPYERMGAQFVRNAATVGGDRRSDPSSLAEYEIEIFRRLIAASNLRVSAQLRDELPGLLRLYQQGVLSFWANDRSAGYIRTYRLVEGSVDLIWQLIRLSAVPLMSPITQRFLNLMTDLRKDGSPKLSPPESVRNRAKTQRPLR